MEPLKNAGFGRFWGGGNQENVLKHFFDDFWPAQAYKLQTKFEDRITFEGSHI
jgi:hypothetical protein